jgi:PEGA domain
MKSPFPVVTVLAVLVALAGSGCAAITKGRKQAVVVRSTPSGATATINGTEVGVTPFKVKLNRDDVFRIDLAKDGFVTETAIVLPSTKDYDARHLRWGVDYDFGYAPDLIPTEMSVEMKPALGDVVSDDRYVELSAQIVRADAMLASGQLTAADHKYLIEKILAIYHTK